MCGIAGFMYFDGAPVQESVIREMSDVMVHRGPDEHGVYLGSGAALGHRRLSIIDLSSGQQPLCNEDRKVWISFNGEIYNYHELQQQLSGSHTFRTQSDTETIVHLYESYPDTFVEKLRGMFSFALWDERSRTMILARDRVGKKPLYYYIDNQKLVFGSEIKAILRHPALDLKIDDQAVSDYISARLHSGSEIDLPFDPEGPAGLLFASQERAESRRSSTGTCISMRRNRCRKRSGATDFSTNSEQLLRFA